MTTEKNPLAPPDNIVRLGKWAVSEWRRVAPCLYKRDPDGFPWVRILLFGYCMNYQIYTNSKPILLKNPAWSNDGGSVIPDGAKKELKRLQDELAFNCEKIGMPWDEEGRMIVDGSVVLFDKYKGKTDLEGLDEILGWAESDFRGADNKIARTEWNRVIPELVERDMLEGKSTVELNKLIRYCYWFQQYETWPAIQSLLKQCNEELPFNHLESCVENMQHICTAFGVPCDERGVMIFSNQVVSIDSVRNRKD